MEDKRTDTEKTLAGRKKIDKIRISGEQAGDVPHKKEGLFVLEASSLGQNLKVSGFERTVGEERPVKGYREIRFNKDRIKAYTKGIIDLLNRANRRGKITSDLLVKLKELGRLMFDDLIPVAVKDKLINTRENNLMISIDDKLVFIPWELLYDGKEFLCQRFSIGRSVSTQQQVSAVARVVGSPLKMQLLVDPGGDLKASYKEGTQIKNEIGLLDDFIHITLKSTDIRTDYVRSKMRNFDIVHYAGHAVHNSREPEKSGWVLKDGKLSAEEVMNLIGSMPMPSLVFSNACQSGQTEEWKIGEDYEDKIFGLANAFLLSGVQHYIGTFWEIPDEAGSFFALNFYKNLAKGVPVGEAMRKARMALINTYGEDTIVWASYMLYGDPTSTYFHTDMAVKEREPFRKTVREELASQELRHKEEVVHLLDGKKKLKNRIVIGLCALLVIISGAVFINRLTTEKPVMTSDLTTMAAPPKRIDMLIASLARKYRQGNFAKVNKNQDEWSTQPLTVVLMDVIYAGDSGDDKKELLLRLLPQAIKKEARITMVERDLIEKLLEELQLSTSDLADPLTSLKIGKVFSAKFIITGSIIPDKDKLIVILRCIDTETTAVRKVISAESPVGKMDKDFISSLGMRIIDWIKAEFPLKGRIVAISGDRYQINLGMMHGLQKGDRLEVLHSLPQDIGTPDVMGEAEIIEIGKDRSWVHVLGNTDMLKEGARIREKRTG